MTIFEDLGKRPMVVIRFNPDSYIKSDNTKIPSCFNHHKTLDVPKIKNKVDLENRINTLKNTIDDYVNNIPEKELTIIKLFFNEN